MISPDIKKKITQLRLRTRRMLSGSLIGDYSTALKGSGFEFDQIRAYEQGDDVRFIDWKSSARSNTMLIKQYLEERNRTIFLAVDVSSSSYFSSKNAALKYEIMTQVAGILAIVADYGKDKVGLLLFSDSVEEVIQPGCGNVHLQKLMNKLFTYTVPQQKKTNLNAPLEYLLKFNIHNAVVFLISDFIDMHSLDRMLSVVARRCELIAIRCTDKAEDSIPQVGLLRIRDIETGEHITLNTTSMQQDFMTSIMQEKNKLFKKYNIDTIDVTAHYDYMPMIVQFFRRRMMY